MVDSVIAWGVLSFGLRWGSPLSAALGFSIAAVAIYSGSVRAMGFGGGLFVFSIGLFILAGGMRDAGR